MAAFPRPKLLSIGSIKSEHNYSQLSNRREGSNKRVEGGSAEASSATAETARLPEKDRKSYIILGTI